ncbi:hypothetical protein KAI46_03980, partial [bacterium]|nr:hypothetical protein [bacterium]
PDFWRLQRSTAWQDAKILPVEVKICLGNLDILYQCPALPWTPAQPLSCAYTLPYVLSWPLNLQRCGPYLPATPLSLTRSMPYILCWPLSAETCGPYEEGRETVIVLADQWSEARSLPVRNCSGWQPTQEPTFVWPIPVQDPETPDPPVYFSGDPNLNLICLLPDPIWGGVQFNLGIAEICQQALPFGWLPPGFIPRRVIIVTHDLFIKLLSDDSLLPCTNIGLSIDRDSWGWSWTANLCARSPELLTTQHTVEISIDGYLWRGIIENMSGSRQHGHTGYTVGGRSLAAQLSAPFTAPRNRTETETRTAIQLADAELLNTGWTLDWQAIDWLVDAGCFSYSDLTPIGAIKQIAESIDAIVQAHPITQTLTVSPRYSVSPWDLATATPDITIPGDILRSESVDFKSPALMRGIWISGQSQGVMTRVYRTGSDGAPYAQMIVDPLITTIAAARERGRSQLSTTGRRREVTLPMVLVPEIGILTPGQTTEITDPDGAWRGYIDAVNIAATRTKVTQTATIEQVLEV